MPVVIGAHRDHDPQPAAVLGQDVDERPSLGLVARGSEDLLELVDGEHHPPVGGEPGDGITERVGRVKPFRRRVGQCARQGLAERGHGVLAGSHEHLQPPIAAGQDPAGEGRQEARSKRGRLAAARGADETEERVADHLGHQLGDEPVAAEVVLGVDGVERRRGPCTGRW